VPDAANKHKDVRMRIVSSPLEEDRWLIESRGR
jgi:hypothetical protein